jgi:hypothetical protein
MARNTVMEYLALVARYALGAAVLLVALIGCLFITRGTAVRHVRGVGADGTPVAPAEPEFPLTAAALTGAVLTGGNRAELALNGDGTFPRLRDDLRWARRSITVQMYYGWRSTTRSRSWCWTRSSAGAWTRCS